LLGRLPLALAVVPRFQRDEEETVVGGGDEGEQAEAAHRVVVPHPLGLRQEALDLAADGVRPLQRGGVGELHVQVEITLVLVGKEAAGERAADPAGREAEAEEDQEGEDGLADEEARGAEVAAARLLEAAVGGAEEAGEPAARPASPT